MVVFFVESLQEGSVCVSLACLSHSHMDHVI